MSKNRSLKVNLSLHNEDNAAYIAFRAAKYKPDKIPVILVAAGEVPPIVKYVYLLLLF